MIMYISIRLKRDIFFLEFRLNERIDMRNPCHDIINKKTRLNSTLSLREKESMLDISTEKKEKLYIISKLN